MTTTPSTSDPDIVDLAETIRQYLSQHPNAADTLEGVVNWWLLSQRYECAMNMVSQALEMLVQQGVLTKLKNRGSQTIFMVNKESSR